MTQLTTPTPPTLDLFQVATEHFNAQRLGEAEQVLREILNRMPEHPDALHLLGLVAHTAGNSELAVQLISWAIQRRSDWHVYYSNLGLVLQSLQRLDEAAQCQQRAIALAPRESAPYFNLATIVQARGDYGRAIELYRKVIELDPSSGAAFNNLGACLQLTYRLKEAIECYKHALVVSPKAGWENNMAIALRDQARIDESLEAHQRAMDLAPDDPIVHANMLRTLHFWEHYDSKDCSAKHIAWGKKFATPLYKLVQPHHNDANPDRRLRLGFVSGDFRAHAVATFLEPLMAVLNREQFEVYCYANEVVADVTTKRFQQLANGWRDVTGINDDRVADFVRTDKIDILIDVAGLTAGNRILVFARKPAPVQITWLGYQDTTGLETIDYRITDGWCDPPGLTDQYYTEKLYRMPHCFACYTSPINAPEIEPLPALKNGYVTLASLNNYGKVSPRVVATFSEILKRVPNSKMVVFIPGAERCGELVYPRFAEHGIGRDRLELTDRLNYPAYRQQFQRIDIAFDPFPCSGHTTMCDGLWAGVPSITLEGDSYVSRMGISVLQNVGLSQFITKNLDQYIQTAVDLATDLPRLAGIRPTLRSKIQQSPIGNHSQFARDMEAAYRYMWREWCKTWG